MITPQSIEPGVYKHYKGDKYEVIGVAKHTETLEEMVVYRPLYESDVQHWVRPLAMFRETVEIEGQVVPRFLKVSSDE